MTKSYEQVVHVDITAARIHAVMGTLGISIDDIVNSQESKARVLWLYKTQMQFVRRQQEKDRAAFEKYNGWVKSKISPVLGYGSGCLISLRAWIRGRK